MPAGEGDFVDGPLCTRHELHAVLDATFSIVCLTCPVSALVNRVNYPAQFVAGREYETDPVSRGDSLYPMREAVNIWYDGDILFVYLFSL